jgi:threonine/homoserine/homoserine lactone efflux protein
MLLVMSHSARLGLRAAIMTMAGCMTALLCMMRISAAGWGALLHTFPAVLDALRYVGAACLACLGYKLGVFGWPSTTTEKNPVGPLPERSGGSFYRQGWAVAASR